MNNNDIGMTNCVYHPVKKLNSAKCPHCGEINTFHQSTIDLFFR